MEKKSKTLVTLRKEAEDRLKKRMKSAKNFSLQNMQDFAYELGTYQIELEMQNEELRRAQEQLEESRHSYADLYDFAPIGYFTFDKDGLILQLNLTAAGLLDVDRRHLINKPFSLYVINDDRDIFRAYLREALASKTLQIAEIRIMEKGGRAFYVQLQSIAAKDPEGAFTICRTAAIDINARRLAQDQLKIMEEEMKRMAHHDAMTGLPNRRLFEEILNLELAQARRHQNKLAILFLDLDRFKYINDTLGHDIGDELLKEVAERMKHCIRESDTAARIGGDEFNMLLADIARSEDVIDVVMKIVSAFNEPFWIRGHELHATASIGISIYPDDADTMNALFKSADIAMYHAKRGGNTYQFYNPSMNIRSIERMRLEGWLRQAISRGKLEVYYQPQVTTDTRQMVCAEALVRWNHPEQGVLGPKYFITLAEETGLIMAIDEWVLRTACAQFRAWQEAGLLKLCITVNISAKEFQKSDIVDRISLILQETGLDPKLLAIEITESVAMKNLEHSIANMNRLKDMGIRISIDDFGTGYSSLSYLKKLPIQKLKIDQSFIKDIATDSDDRAIINAVVAMARSMSLKVIAEGVETEQQLEYLRSIGCQEMQGYLFSRPLPAKEFRELMATNA